MKCQRCPKPACYHITEVHAPEQVEELHLCEDCAKKHLYEPAPAPNSKKPANKAAVLPDDDPAEIGGKQCGECGTKFVEFRNTGRLGCPHDYDAFRDELLPLLENIHGDVKHAGKSPRRLPAAKAHQQELAQLRRKLSQAVTEEAYEEAARLRDRIKELEDG